MTRRMTEKRREDGQKKRLEEEANGDKAKEMDENVDEDKTNDNDDGDNDDDNNDDDNDDFLTLICSWGEENKPC